MQVAEPPISCLLQCSAAAARSTDCLHSGEGSCTGSELILCRNAAFASRQRHCKACKLCIYLRGSSFLSQELLDKVLLGKDCA